MAGLWRRQVAMVVGKVRQKTSPRRMRAAGGRCLPPTGGVHATAGFVVGRIQLPAFNVKTPRLAIRMTRALFARGRWVAGGAESALQQKDGGRRSLFAVSSCRNRKNREGAPKRRLARSEAECCRFGGESIFSKVNELVFPPQH